MAQRTYDTIVVGARCAGASLATYLARSGARVIVLEAGRLGADQVISTHTIHPAGMDLLDELEVGAAVREVSPPARVIRFEVDGAFADIEPPAGRHECCPRRYRLDRLLQEAAAAAGAEICESTRATELLRENGRVVGVRAERAGQSMDVRGDITVGADGRHSTVTKLAGAEEYLGYNAPRAMYWAYWEPPAAWTSSAYPYDMLLKFSGINRRVIFSTDDGQLLLSTLPPVEVARRWKPYLTAQYLSDLRSDPVFEPLVDEGKMASKVVGTIRERFFFRRAVGPGWALVGDAGHHKDPIMGWGISEALAQAKQLSQAILDGSETALERYWRRRDVDTLPRYRLGEDRAALKPMTPVFPVVLAKTKRNPKLKNRLFSETEFDVNPYEVLPVPRVALWTLEAAVRGRPGLILDLIAQAKRGNAVQAELRQRKKLLDAVAGKLIVPNNGFSGQKDKKTAQVRQNGTK